MWCFVRAACRHSQLKLLWVWEHVPLALGFVLSLALGFVLSLALGFVHFALDFDVYVLEFCAQCNIFGHRVYLCFLWVVCVLHTG